MVIISLNSLAKSGVALLRVDRLAPLIAVKLLKNNVFHNFFR